MIRWMLWGFLPSVILGQCFGPNDRVFNYNPGASQALYQGQQQFSLNLLQAVNSKMPRENIFFSPMSIYNAILLAYFISSNHTEKYIRKALALPEVLVSIEG